MTYDRTLLPPARLEFIVLGDTHFIEDAEAYAIEFDSVRQWPQRAAEALRRVADLGVDTLIHLGDICEEPPVHADHQASRDTALASARGLGLQPWYVPGNMDIGDKPDPTMWTPPVSDATLAWFHDHIGPSWFSFDRGEGHFVCINSQILNGALDAASEQAKWLEAELSEHRGERIFLFLHMPPFFVAEDEPDTGFYNSIDEPARSWLTGLMRQHRIEAVFCGHTHFRAHNRVGATRLHICPSTTTSRAGFYECFTVGPPPEGGRNDPDKLGFYLVRVLGEGLRVHFIRTGGATGPGDEGVDEVLTRTSADLPGSPLGLNLRSPLVVESAGALAWPSVKRQRVRDDHPFLAALELGARHLRVPESDLADPLQSQRLDYLRDEGDLTITAQFVWSAHLDLPARVAGLAMTPDSIELQTPGLIQPDDAIVNSLRRTRETFEGQLSLAPLLPHERVPGRYHPRGRLGFRADELAGLVATLAAADLRLDRLLCVLEGDDPWAAIVTLADTGTAIDLVYPLDLVEKDERAWQLSRALVAASQREGVRLFVDPYTDLDRTNDLRQGLLDRLGNPRPIFHTLRCLNTLLFADAQWKVTRVSATAIDLTRPRGDTLHLRQNQAAAQDVPATPSTIRYHLKSCTSTRLDRPLADQPDPQSPLAFLCNTMASSTGGAS